MSGRLNGGGASEVRRLRAWLEYVAQAAIDWLDELDAASEDLEDDEREIYLAGEDAA